ncbi:ABC transporter permease [Compostimonas suwonensis]|uniref:Ribose transport system permease protein/inositol transport system permease protein n=1 Tax=Compostimonas suwonensis TaxID=1048394 RepID=A0A2M9BUT3_9MICO|nr:ABC transporter permease [Compostimonas suwonensis]PJJ61703.1 ribose transport system permease protein/inositol transport system permease protein [Compostimonas suwonensis]
MTDIKNTDAAAVVENAPPEPAATTSAGRAVGKIVIDYAMIAVLIALLIVATVIYPGFLEPNNLLLILSQTAPLGLVAVGMTFVIIAGGFDLSVGAVYAVAGTVAAALAQDGAPPVVGLLAGVGLGLVLGSVNGVLVARLGINPFIATLGTSSVYLGGILLFSNSQPFAVSDDGFKFLGAGKLGPVPVSVIVLVLVFLIGAAVLHVTPFGRRIFAVGGNAEAARLSGISVRMVRGSTYTISGFLAALAGVMAASRIGVGQGDVGANVALDAIAVVVIGGTSLTGGEGKMWRTAVGLLILAVLNNIFFSLAVDSNWQLVTKGAIVVLAVAVDQVFRHRARSL